MPPAVVADCGGCAPFSTLRTVRVVVARTAREIHDTRFRSEPSAPPYCPSPSERLAWHRAHLDYLFPPSGNIQARGSPA